MAWSHVGLLRAWVEHLVTPAEGLLSGSCEKFYLLGYSALKSIQTQPTFRRKRSASRRFIACLVLGH
jgi:hypothetical protein